MSLTLTVAQQATLVARSKHEPRRNLKRFLKDLGGEGSAEELDRVLAAAVKNKTVVQESQRLERQRQLTAATVEAGIDGGVAEMLADIRVRMEEQQLTQSTIAERCGWPQSLVSAYLSGNKEPGARNLAKLATALGCAWRLTPVASP